jgi:transcription initiation factor IIF auxiliary subunit
MSCVGWAVAYACKSYQETRDQGWRPDSNRRVFSPSFIYNQINKGYDRGSNFIDAFNILINKGCATLSTMPYDSRNFTRSPSSAAIREAVVFKCRDYYPVRSGAAIRKALQNGHVVILGIRTNPVFMSGKFPIYTAREKAAGDANMNPNAPHGNHAICVVGYDDTRNAFLLMNSYGRNWGQEGFCWVDYDLMRNIGPYAGNFVRCAYIVLDIQKKVTEQTIPPQKVDKNIKIIGNSWYTGYMQNNHNWVWNSSIGGSRRAMGNISRVVWSVKDSVRTREYLNTTDAANSFIARGTVKGIGFVDVMAVVYFRDRTSRNLSYRFTFNRPAQRNMTLEQTDRYWGKVSGRSNWEWTLRIKGNLVDLADIRQVTYHLHPTFPNPDRVVRGTMENGFAFTTRGWGTFLVRATVLLKDGSTLQLTKNLDFKDRVRDALRLTNIARPSYRSESGRPYYDWTAFVDGPLNLLRNIRGVRYTLHPTFHPNVRDVTQGAEFGFPLSTSGWGEFRLYATVFYRNGATEQLTHDLVLFR